jgi:transcriptional regulator with XRE-family HTH domain
MPDVLTRVRRLRELCDLSQDEVADKLNMTQGAYSRLENGKTRLDIDRLDQIARIYGFNHTDLLTQSSVELIRRLLDRPDFKEKGGGKW